MKMNEIVSVKDGKITVAEDMVNKIIEFNKAKKKWSIKRNF